MNKLLTITQKEHKLTIGQTAFKGMVLVSGKTGNDPVVYGALSMDWLTKFYLTTKILLKDTGHAEFKMPNGERICLTLRDIDAINAFLNKIKKAA